MATSADVGHYLLFSRVTSGSSSLQPTTGRALPPVSSARLNGSAYESSDPKRYAQSLLQSSRSSRPPAYSIAAAKMPTYHRDGTGAARDAWITAQQPATKGYHVETAEELYWKAKLSKPEHRGKCKAARVDGSVGDRTPRKRLPLVPSAAPLPQAPTLEAVARRGAAPGLSPRQREMSDAEVSKRCDQLAAHYLDGHRHPTM